MTYTVDSPLLATGVLTRDELIAAANDMEKPLDGGTVADLQDTTGLDGTLMMAHMMLETDNGTSDFWVNRNNPGGIGAIDSAPGDALTFNTPRDGIIADFSHMLTYVRGNRNPMRASDPRYLLVVDNPIAGNVRTVGQLGNGVWASDPNYAGKVVGIANNLVARYHQGSGVPSSPPQQRGGSMVPDQSYSLPVRTDLANNAHSFVNRPTNPDGRILAIVKHVTAGESLEGALSWNRNPDVQASAHFYIDKDGTTVQDVSLFNGAWANGVLANDTLPAQFDDVKANGWNPNDFTISIEHVGNPDDADFPTPAQLTADARLCADLCDYFHIPVDTDHIIGHYRFDAVNRPHCPGDHWDFDADVRAVSQLLNGVTPDGNTATPADGQPDAGGVGTSTGSDSGNPRPNGGDPGSGSGITTGTGSGNVGGNVPGSQNDWGRAIGDGIRVGDESADGDGRGFTVRYDGDPGPGIRVGHGFYDKYTADGFDNGYARYGSVRCSEFAGFVPGTGNATDPAKPVTVQIFTFAALVYDGANVIELPSGVLAAHWLQTHGVVLPADMHW